MVISLHDVSPLTRDVFTAMLKELAEIGVTQTSLLVIPDHHHRGHMLDDAGFCRWLEALAKTGHEVVVHGYYHQRPRRTGETLGQRWLTNVYTTGEGEFYDLSKDEAASLLDRAKRDFQKIDCVRPLGFIAPAWLLGSAAAEAVREAGFLYTTYLTGVHHHQASIQVDRFFRSQSLVYSCRNRWRRACSLLWNAALRRRLQSSFLLRLGLHPPDYKHPSIWRQILRFVREEQNQRLARSYEWFVETWWALEQHRAVNSGQHPPLS